ncbi:unnamed protein product [Prorocentrum cordatum]|uniref:VWFA domain-containing protein n=1 Tax=Prorocentrum cordatum TaxID=2364126 RepID=A0ABN9TYT2_9DINO|nr:unnamed protein product [Polarella glacialis]
MCTIGELHCGHVHASAVVLLGELKDSADEIRDRMATDAEHAREANEEIDLQLQLLHQSKGELSSQLAEATSRLNAVEEQVAHAAAEAQALQLEAGRRRSEHERREHDLLSSQVCSMRQLRSATVAESTTVVEDDIVDCEVSDWEPGECSLECDDSCPAWGSDAKPCGGERTMTRQVIQEASEYGVQCPPLQQVIPCSQVRCPVDCQMSEWSGWSSCTRHCNGGVRQRTRSVLQEPKNGGEACDAVEETQPCGTGACAAACELAEWTEWSACSAACGTGYQQRFQFPRAPHQCPADKSEGHQEAQECTEATCQGDEACIAKQDIVVAVDSSGSLTAEEFANVTSFTSALLGKFNGTAYGQNASRIGVVQFGNGEIYGVDQTPTDAIKVLDFSTDNNTILAAVYGLQQQSGFANSAQAMALAETMLDEGAGDSGRNRMLLMVAASTPPFQRQSQLKARELSRKGIRVFFVTVADSSRGAEARAAKDGTMATAPTLANFVHVAWHDMATEQSAYVSSALAASCSLAESPTLVAEEIRERGERLRAPPAGAGL